MYPSDGYVNTAFPDNDFNPSLGIQDLSSSSSCLFHSSSPFNLYEDEAIYLQHIQAILYETTQDIVATNNISVTENTENSSQNDVSMREYLCPGGSTDQPVAKKKMSKKDRHSKINTAHGPRDRRMRLSLDVARKFFGLQDMLGFDKASKTVEWLMEQSKPAIKEVTGGFPDVDKGSSIVTVSASSTSDCDVVSGVDESIPRTTSSKTVLPSACSKEKRTRSVRKPTLHPRAKESREKARERARERTKEKRQQKLDVQQSTSLMTRRPFGNSEEPVGTSHNTSSYNDLRLSVEVEKIQNARKQQMQRQGTREESINISDPNFFKTGNWSPSALFSYQKTSGISHEHRFTDF